MVPMFRCGLVRTKAVLAMMSSRLLPKLETGPLERTDPPPVGAAGRSGKGQLRAPAKAAKAVASQVSKVSNASKVSKGKAAALGASATADGAGGKAYRDMPQILPDRPRRVE